MCRGRGKELVQLEGEKSFTWWDCRKKETMYGVIVVIFMGLEEQRSGVRYLQFIIWAGRSLWVDQFSWEALTI